MSAKYGQHFLINQHAIDRIIQSLELTPEDQVLEIGPGKGALTAHFQQVKSLTVVEVDADMVKFLRDKFGVNPNCQIVHADILEFDLSSLVGAFKVVGNLPYNLTSPILRKLSEWDGWSFACVMVQKEVGERICAAPGTPEYGALTVGMSLICTAAPVFELSEKSFSPPPKVKSMVIKLTRRAKPLTDDIASCQRVIQAAFQQRRKTILNSLSHGLSVDKERVGKALSEFQIDPGIRAETLSPAQFISLAGALLPRV